MFTRSRQKLGFTLVELVTVMGLVSVGLSVSLPGIQKARNQARLTACKNNLKQLGLALHNYHDVYNSLPPGWIIKETKADAGPGFGWGTSILPFVDQAALYNQANFSAPPKVDKLTQASLPVYLCPEDTAAALNSVRGKFATSNYSGNSGDQLLPGSVDLPDPGTDAAKKLSTGIFFHNSHVKFRDITDGTSNTIMLGEKSVSSAAGIWMGVRSNQNADDSVTDCNHRSKLNAVIHSFSSLHEGGANFLLVDGSVRFITNTVESKESAEKPVGVYQKLAHKNDGEVIGEF
jgi:prepilin-type N-terminal cleavage/methylation domain-containing protein/prepilin-type processing-associated H-X9-DG protein